MNCCDGEQEIYRDLSVSAVRANAYSLIFSVPFAAVFAAVFIGIWGLMQFLDGFSLFLRLMYFIPALIAGIIVHEVIHGITWAYCGRKPLKTVTFGCQLKSLTLYAHCREPMGIGAYRTGALMPGLITGIVPSAIGIATGNGWIMAYGILFTVAAGGDMLVLWLIRGVEPGKLVKDHPARAGCYVIEKREKEHPAV